MPGLQAPATFCVWPTTGDCQTWWKSGCYQILFLSEGRNLWQCHPAINLPTRNKEMLHHETYSEAHAKPNPTQTTKKELFGRSWYDLTIDLLIHHSVRQRIHMTQVFPNHVRRVPNKMDSLVWNMKLSSHISSVNYFTSAVKENRCNEQLIIQNNHPLNPIPLLNIFRGRSAMVGFTHNVNWVHWPVFHVGPHQPSCAPHLWVSRQLPAPSRWPSL